jgi:hypothetical protein
VTNRVTVGQGMALAQGVATRRLATCELALAGFLAGGGSAANLSAAVWQLW